jgi:hypothetical protein
LISFQEEGSKDERMDHTEMEFSDNEKKALFLWLRKDIHQKLKILSAQENQSMTGFITDIVEEIWNRGEG